MTKGIVFDEIGGSGWMDIDDAGKYIEFNYQQGDGEGFRFLLDKHNIDEVVEFLLSCKPKKDIPLPPPNPLKPRHAYEKYSNGGK